MKKTQVIVTIIEADEGMTLVKAVPSSSGEFSRGDESYTLVSGTRVAATEADVAAWVEADSVDAFVAANRLGRVVLPQDDYISFPDDRIPDTFELIRGKELVN